MPRRSIADQTASEPVEALLRRPSKAKRDRSWEREHKGETVTFRGIPPALRQALNRVAKEKGVTVSEVGRAFLEHALAAYERGELELKPQLVTGKLSLFPEK